MGTEERSNTGEIEFWLPVTIEKYSDCYEVSNLGGIRSLDRKANSGRGFKGQVIKPSKSKAGYFRVILSKAQESLYITLHRLVALAHVPNPHNHTIVNHINGIKLDCRASNLEWCTQSHNAIHAMQNGLSNPINNLPKEVSLSANGRAKKIYQFSTKGKFIREWGCAEEAAIFFKGSGSTILGCANKLHMTAFGFIWSFNRDFSIIGYNMKGARLKRIVQLLDNDKNVVEEFINSSEAGLKTKIYRQDIYKVCMGKRKTAGGRSWKFKETTA